jgi:hypothetical protein
MNSVPQEQLEDSLIEKLKGIKDADKHVAAFVKSATKSMKIKDLGISKAISKIRESQSYHYPALKYALDRFERAKINEGILDYLIVEEFIGTLKEFVWDKNVKESLDQVRESYESEKEAVLVSKSLHEFRNARGNFIFEKMCEMLEDHFDNPSEASRSALIEALVKFSYSPVAKNLAENLKRIQSSAVTPNGLNIISENNNCSVVPVFSTIFVENGKEYFTIKGDVYKKEGIVVEKVTPEEFQSLSENVRRSYEILNSTNFFVKEGKASFYLGKNKIEISEGENCTKVLFNGKSVPSSDIAKNLVSTGMIRLEEAKVASDIQFINDIFENFYEIDFAKVITSKIYEGSYVALMKVNENIYLNKVNSSMRSNEFFSNLNATQARNLILEFIGYDIKEAMVEFLEKDEAEILVVREQQSVILTNMTIVEGELHKIEAAKQDAFLASQPQIKSLEEMLSKELQGLKDQYTDLSVKLKKFEAKSSDAGVEIGEDVKLTDTGETATVTAIDSNTKKVSVVTSDGKTSEHPISNITSVEKAQESAVKKNEDDAEVEAEKEPTHKPEEDEEEKVDEATPNLGDIKKKEDEEKSEEDEEEKVEEKKKDDAEAEEMNKDEKEEDETEEDEVDEALTAGQKKLPKGLQDAILKKQGEKPEKEDKEEKEEEVDEALTAGQKKLPKGLQDAILKKQGEKPEKEDDKEDEKVEEATDNLSAGNEISVEDPNKDKLISQEPTPEPTKVEDGNPEYVGGKVSSEQEGSCAGKDVEVLAADMAAKGPDDLIQVKCDGELFFIEKKFIEVSTTEADDSTTIDFDAAPPDDEKKDDEKKDDEKKDDSEEKSDDSEKKEGGDEEKSDDGEKKEGGDEEKSDDGEKKEDSDEEKKEKPSIEELQSKLAKALEDLEQIKNDMKDSFTSNETISATINSLRGLNDAFKRDIVKESESK